MYYIETDYVSYRQTIIARIFALFMALQSQAAPKDNLENFLTRAKILQIVPTVPGYLYVKVSAFVRFK